MLFVSLFVEKRCSWICQEIPVGQIPLNSQIHFESGAMPKKVYENASSTKTDKELHMKRRHNDKTAQYISSPHNRKVDYTCFAGNS